MRQVRYKTLEELEEYKEYMDKFDVYQVGEEGAITHMKPAVNFLKTDARPWTSEFVWELDNGHLRINTVEQHDAVHYHEKIFAKELEKHYDKLLASR